MTMKNELSSVLEQFQIDGTLSDIVPYGNGHINQTYCATYTDNNKSKRYILQRINTEIFTDPIGLMNNIAGVTQFLRKGILSNNGDPSRETLTLIKTKSDKFMYCDDTNHYWRIYLFIEDVTTFDLVEKPEDFFESGRAFGHFQRLLADYPVAELSETIKNFHNTPLRFETFQTAVKNDICGRASSVSDEIAFVMSHACDMDAITSELDNGTIPKRVTHNDTKLNNIMIDNQSGKAICVIDLDTIMPGSSLYDFGDSIRFGASTALEDEQDLEKVSISLTLFEHYTKGYLLGCGGSLLEREIQLMPMGAKIMTLECGMRFLTDYLQGDTYFRIHHAHQNLDRARTQFKLVTDMENKWSQLETIVNNAKSEVN